MKMGMDHMQTDTDSMKGMEGMAHMQPVWRWAAHVPVLFRQWTTDTVLGLALALVVSAAMAAVYEVLRNWLSTWDNNTRQLATMPRWRSLCLRLWRSGLHAVTAAVGYVQMLLAMTWDARLFLAIIAGAGLGFFLLGPRLRRRGRRSARGGRGGGAEGEALVKASASPRGLEGEGAGPGGRRGEPGCDTAVGGSELIGRLQDADVDRETVL